MRVRRGLFELLTFFTLAGCTDGLALSVDVKTDFVPGAEFAAVRVTLVGEGQSNTVGAAGDYLLGQRAIDLDGLEENRGRIVSVELLDALGSVVAERSALVDHRVDRGLTFTLARDCVGISCPWAGAAAATACFGGRCTEPDCIDGTEPSCPEPECRVNTDCPMLNACSSRRCIGTLCLYAPVIGACESGTYCSPEMGCLALPSPVDASTDATPGDAGTDASIAPLTVPTLTWPQNGVATGPAQSVTFHWLPIAGANTYSIEMRAGCAIEMATPCASTEVVSTMASTAEIDLDLMVLGVDAMPAGRRYRWRVRACRDEDDCGDWSTERYLDVGRGPSDFDGEGTDELLVGSAGGVGHVTVLEYQGGAFTPTQEIPTPFSDMTSGFAQSSQVGDVNGDGYMDAVIGARYDRGFGSVAIYHGGPGGLTLHQLLQSPPSSPINGSFSRALCIADFDADGHADLAVGATRGTYVFRGSADGIVPVLVAELPSKLNSCADVNEDGRADIIGGGSYYPGRAAMLVETTSVMLPNPASYFVGDVNGDGFADLTGGSTGESAFIYGNAGGLDPAVPMTGVAGGILSFDYQALALADINGDGLSDVLMGDVQGDSGWPGVVALSLGSMAGVGARAAVNVACNNACNRRGYAISYGFDLDDDGFGDAAVSANDEEGVFVFFGRSTGLDPSFVRVARTQPIFDLFGASL